VVARASASPSSQVGEVLLIELVFDAVLHEIFDDRGPAGHLVSLFSDAFFPCRLVNFLAVPLKILYNELKISEVLI